MIKLAENHFNELSNNRVIITTDGDLSFDQLKQLKEILIKNKNKNIMENAAKKQQSLVIRYKLGKL